MKIPLTGFEHTLMLSNYEVQMGIWGGGGGIESPPNTPVFLSSRGGRKLLKTEQSRSTIFVNSLANFQAYCCTVQCTKLILYKKMNTIYKLIDMNCVTLLFSYSRELSALLLFLWKKFQNWNKPEHKLSQRILPVYR